MTAARRQENSRLDAEAEDVRVLAEDTRREAVAVRERDAAMETAREAGRTLAEARNMSRVLTARVAELSAQLADVEARGASAVEEWRIAVEELRVSVEEKEDANLALTRANDVLEQRVAKRTAELAATVARLRAATEALPDLTWSSGADGLWTWANRRWEAFTGVPEVEARGAGWLRSVHPEDHAKVMAAWAEAERTGELRVDHRLRRTDGQWRWFSTRALPVRHPASAGAGPGVAGAGGPEVREWFGVSTDVDEARRMAAALRDSEARFRGFAEATPDVFWIADARTGGIAYLSPAFEEVWGELRGRPGTDRRSAGDLAGGERAAGAAADDEQGADGAGSADGRWMQALHPDDRASAVALHDAALAGERVDGEYRIRRPSDGALRWICDVAFPVLDPCGAVRFAAGVARDVTERKDAEERHGLLMRELDHRVKNALAVAQSLAAQTARTTDTPHAFASAFTERLRAFGRAQDLLTGAAGRGALLADVVETTLAPHGDGAARVSREGPPVRLSPAATISLQMAFHELATNAARYGALSVPDGQVRVEWRADPGAGPGGGLAITWEERGGPPVDAQPSRRGFGTRLIEQAVPRQLGGEVRLDFPAGGLRCIMRLPLTKQVHLEAD